MYILFDLSAPRNIWIKLNTVKQHSNAFYQQSNILVDGW